MTSSPRDLPPCDAADGAVSDTPVSSDSSWQRTLVQHNPPQTATTNEHLYHLSDRVTFLRRNVYFLAPCCREASMFLSLRSGVVSVLWPSLLSLVAAGCEVGFSESRCVVGPVMRAMNLSLPHRHTLRSHSWPIWPTTPTSPLPLSGWDDRGREPGEESEKQRSLPRLALQMWCVCLPGGNAAYARWTGGRGTGRVLYPKMNFWQSHATFAASGWQRARPISHGDPCVTQL